MNEVPETYGIRQYEAQYPGRVGCIDSTGFLEGTSFPTRIYWAYVDLDDTAYRGVFGIVRDHIAGDQTKSRAMNIVHDDDLDITYGRAVDVAVSLNSLFRGARVDVLAAYNSPVRRLFRAVDLDPSWQGIDHWLPTRMNPWSDLIVRTADQCDFIPRYPDLNGVPDADRPQAYVIKYRAMRRASRRLSMLGFGRD